MHCVVLADRAGLPPDGSSTDDEKVLVPLAFLVSANLLNLTQVLLIRGAQVRGRLRYPVLRLAVSLGGLRRDVTR